MNVTFDVCWNVTLVVGGRAAPGCAVPAGPQGHGGVRATGQALHTHIPLTVLPGTGSSTTCGKYFFFFLPVANVAYIKVAGLRYASRKPDSDPVQIGKSNYRLPIYLFFTQITVVASIFLFSRHSTGKVFRTGCGGWAPCPSPPAPTPTCRRGPEAGRCRLLGAVLTPVGSAPSLCSFWSGWTSGVGSSTEPASSVPGTTGLGGFKTV